jgi:hypothetical protein
MRDKILLDHTICHVIVDREPQLTGAETLGATAVSWLASVVAFAYFADRIGLTIASLPILAASIAAAAAMFLWLRRDTVWRRGGIAAFTGLIGTMLAWLAWLAWPELLPPGGGSNLAHRLQLVDYIDRNRRLVHDPTVEWYLAEMVHYTPGAHVIGTTTVRAGVPKPVVSESLYRAGEWARAHVDPACVDYIVAHDNTAYWLHLSVLGNRRMSDRTATDSTFIPRDAIVRWINQGGLPYAIADLRTIPRDVLETTDELARFGSAVVIKRKGQSACASVGSR